MDRREFLTGITLLLAGCASRTRNGITVGSKNFTEQLILGELLAQTLEHSTSQPIDRRFYLAGSYICHQAILAGRIDTYVEYTGTALAAVLKESTATNHALAFQRVKDEYHRRFDLEVLPPLGFNNSFAIVMRGEDARKENLTKLSQLAPLAPKMRMGIGYEFLERQDGYKGLIKVYDLKFAEAPRIMDLGLLYRSLEAKQVDVVAGSNTDGLITALDLVVLEDDRTYFPPYDAVPIIRPQALQRPGVREALQRLSGRITAQDMRKLNYAVDGEKRDPAQIVREYLDRLGG